MGSKNRGEHQLCIFVHGYCFEVKKALNEGGEKHK